MRSTNRIIIDRSKLIIPYVNDKLSICKNGQDCTHFRRRICHFMHTSQINACFDLYESTGDIMTAINRAKEFKDIAIHNRDKTPGTKKFNDI